MSLSKTDMKAIDRAIAEKKSSPYVKGYEAAIRELQMLTADGSLTTAEAIARMSQPCREPQA